MSQNPPDEVDCLLSAAGAGERAALDRLISLVYDELREVARRHLARERAGHTLDSVALVNEAYLRMVSQDVDAGSRARFFGIASRLMRQILVDHARSRAAMKRGGDVVTVRLSDLPVGIPARDPTEHLIALDDALSRLSEIDQEACRTVECRCFGGLTLRESADALNLSLATTRRRWAFAKAWLRRELEGAV